MDREKFTIEVRAGSVDIQTGDVKIPKTIALCDDIDYATHITSACYWASLIAERQLGLIDMKSMLALVSYMEANLEGLISDDNMHVKALLRLISRVLNRSNPYMAARLYREDKPEFLRPLRSTAAMSEDDVARKIAEQVAEKYLGEEDEV